MTVSITEVFFCNGLKDLKKRTISCPFNDYFFLRPNLPNFAIRERDTGKWDIGRRRDIISCIKKLVGETGYIFSWNRDILFSGNRTTYHLGPRTFSWETGHWSGNGFILWESDHLSSGNRTTYPLGIGPLIIWDPGHFPGKRDILSSGNGFILWESDHLCPGKYPLGIGNLGDEVQTHLFFIFSLPLLWTIRPCIRDMDRLRRIP